MKKSWYKGKVFVLTGASGDIGSEVCRLFAPLEMRMYLLDLPSPALDALAKELKSLGAESVETLSIDLKNRDKIIEVFDQIKEKEKFIDILFNNAGIGSRCSITNDGTFEEYRKIMEINVDAMWIVLKAAMPMFGRPLPTKKYPNRKEGQLIFSSSAAGKTGVPYMAAYAMSKSAIIALADSIRLEFKIQNQKIDVITSVAAPANTKFYNTPEMVEWIKSYEKRGFLFKFVEAKDIAKRILKASRKHKKEIYTPRWWWLLGFLFVFSHSLIGNLLIKIEKEKK
ncbi:MAG: SDR family NAD(P)-dependent oxidoreductase [Promethearchaeota archaeon]|nr:MAG: SDR family NAD(P)-dependent oxidoreductase [Candidatus Lokiarchaeota archaeon]